MKGDLELVVRNPPIAPCHAPSACVNPPPPPFPFYLSLSPFFFHFLHLAPWLHHAVWTCSRINLSWSLRLYSTQIYVKRHRVRSAGKQASQQQLKMLIVTTAAWLCRRTSGLGGAGAGDPLDRTLTWLFLWVSAMLLPSPLHQSGWGRIFVWTMNWGLTEILGSEGLCASCSGST